MNSFALYEVPLWVLAACITVILLAALELGFRTGVWRQAHTERQLQGSGDMVSSALLALLGLILAFTYGASVSRYDARKVAVIEEANAIGTAFNVAGLAGRHSRSLQEAYLEYARTRAGSDGNISREKLEQILDVSLKAQNRLYPLVQTIVEEGELPAPMQVQLASTLNSVLDMHTVRLAAVVDHLPSIVLYMQLLIACTSLSVSGFNAGLAGYLNRWRMTSFAVVIGAFMMVILDFDRSDTGFVIVNQSSLDNTVASMEQQLSTAVPR